MRKLTQIEFLTIAKKNYPQYDYSETIYDGLNKNVTAICKIHGKFKCRPDYFLYPDRFNEPCKKCHFDKKPNNSGIKYKKNELLDIIEQYTDKFFIVNIDSLKNQVDLTLQDNVLLTCKECGLTVQKRIFDLLYTNYHCKICYRNKKHFEIQEKKMQLFLKNAKEKYPQYDYSKVTPCKLRYEQYIVICPIHGEQIVYPNTFYKKGCPMCESIDGSKESTRRTYTTEQFVNELKNVYGDEYDYSKISYKNWKTKVLLTCSKHGDFLREPVRLLKERRGCPHCQKSLLEQDIMEFLQNNKIDFITQYHIGLKRLDFYLPEYNIGIECQGRQHLFLDSIFNTSIKSIDELYKIDIDKLNLAKKCGISNILYFSRYNVDDYFEKLYTKKEDLLKAIYSYEKLL